MAGRELEISTLKPESGRHKRVETDVQSGSRTTVELPTLKSREWVFAFDRLIVRYILQRLGKPAIRVVLWDGSQTCLSSETPFATVTIHDRITLLRVVWQLSIGFAEGYRHGRIDVRGSLVDICRAAEQTNGVTQSGSWNGIRGICRRRSSKRNSARKNIHHHYDLGNEFYRLWLDEQLVYTCAYFSDPEISLEQAQVEKLDLICRKLDLKAGEEVIEAGCGWGALALHMAREYGVKVRAYNISDEQMAVARTRARKEGLADRVSFITDDWRNVSGPCDRFVSVGMLEHVGPEHYRELSDVIDRVLHPTGLGLIHTIGRNVACPLDGWVQRDIFPGAEPPSLSQMAAVFEPHGFSVLDVENLRLHYQRTLEHWLARFEAKADQVREMFNEEFVRTWRLYLAGSAVAFQYGGLQLFQVLFSRSRNNSIPWTRRMAESKVSCRDAQIRY